MHPDDSMKAKSGQLFYDWIGRVRITSNVAMVQEEYQRNDPPSLRQVMTMTVERVASDPRNKLGSDKQSNSQRSANNCN
jgi:hypothetical protein